MRAGHLARGGVAARSVSLAAFPGHYRHAVLVTVASAASLATAADAAVLA